MAEILDRRPLEGLSPADRASARDLDPETALRRWGVYDDVVARALRVAGLTGTDAAVRKSYEAILEFGWGFFMHARVGRYQIVADLLEQGIPVNFRDWRTGFTALHHAAAGSARPLLRVLIREPECDYTIRDRAGRLPSELAHDPAILRLLLRKQFRQGLERGLIVKRRTSEPAPIR